MTLNPDTLALDKLNPAQCQAVTAPIAHTLVLAGAGSGKTTVLTHRLAWLLATQQTQPYHTLTVTFTNKAAYELRTRIQALLHHQLPRLWVGTFHSIAHRLLRIHWQQADLDQYFQVMDSDDQQRMIKGIIKNELNLDEKLWRAKEAQSFINARKDEAQCSTQVSADDTWSTQMLLIYQAYEQACQRSNSVDFAELILRSYELLQHHTELRHYYQQRFQHILVDEFQDTNTLQYLWLKALAGPQTKLFVVGDEDQSIYGWRGARLDNIFNFNHHFDNSQLLRLEQNYRSTGTILAAANALIAHNQKRLGKNLWTQDHAGEPIYLYRAVHELEEARFVIEKIRAWQGPRQEVAIFYRTTAQSRVFEEALLYEQIPYRIYGSLRFYERLEVKDVLAYLRLLHHPDDDNAFERIINTPKRGIGERTLALLRQQARQQQTSLWQAAQQAVAQQHLKAKARQNILDFLNLIQQLKHKCHQLSLAKTLQTIIRSTAIEAHYRKERKEEAQRRLENLAELVTAAHQFERVNREQTDLISDFLTHTALEAGEGQAGAFVDSVQLMTLHAAKGLEFTVVFLCGLEEGLFPHQLYLDEDKLEEERRLCYVGMTRARQYLYLTYTESRFQYGTRESSRPSRFISEIPPEFIEAVRLSRPHFFYKTQYR
ncbi:MAG: 3'-5' exonuclease [Pseudomonadota bacterium]|nr:3'-5' exonuclease [Pseudomonadota bacterium]